MVMKEHLMPEGMLEEIMNYIDWVLKLNVDNVIFRQLMDFDKNKVTPGRILNYCKEEAVSLLPIWDFFDSKKDFELYHKKL